MRAAAWWLLVLLAGCQGRGQIQAESPAPTMRDAESDDAVPATARAPLSFTVLPSMTLTATLREDTALLQRPTRGSVILRQLPAGMTVQLLGTLDNADGQWQSIGVEGPQRADLGVRSAAQDRPHPCAGGEKGRGLPQLDLVDLRGADPPGLGGQVHLLAAHHAAPPGRPREIGDGADRPARVGPRQRGVRHHAERIRSEERRVGKECRRLCRSRWSPYH
jgi:hypothetical protein